MLVFVTFCYLLPEEWIIFLSLLYFLLSLKIFHVDRMFCMTSLCTEQSFTLELPFYIVQVGGSDRSDLLGDKERRRKHWLAELGSWISFYSLVLLLTNHHYQHDFYVLFFTGVFPLDSRILCVEYAIV